MFFSIRPVLQEDGRVDLYAKQGTTWRLVLTLRDKEGKPLNISFIREVRGQVRRKPSDTQFVRDFNCSVVDAANGRIQIELSASQTATIPARDFGWTKYVYDIEVVLDNGDVYRILEGNLYVSAEVTK
ncbi:MAG: hypothetical protein QXX12_03825 [Nanopusillaceae archaeon]